MSSSGTSMQQPASTTSGQFPQSLDTALASMPQHGITLEQIAGKQRNDSVGSGSYPQTFSSESSVMEDSEEDESTPNGHGTFTPGGLGNGDSPTSTSSAASSSRQHVSRWRRSLMAINIPVGNNSSTNIDSSTPAIDESVLSPTSAAAMAMAASGSYFAPKDAPADNAAFGSSPNTRQGWLKSPFKTRSRNSSSTAIDRIKDDDSVLPLFHPFLW